MSKLGAGEIEDRAGKVRVEDAGRVGLGATVGGEYGADAGDELGAGGGPV